MRKTISSMLFIIALLLFTGCNDFDFSTETNNAPGEVTPIEELQDTDHFLPSALDHILKGEINRKQQAVGYHYEGMPDANGEVIEGTESAEDDQGVYEAKVVVDDIEKKSNQGKSTFFPEDWDSQDVVDAINEAYDARAHVNGNTYEGLTDEGITVRMYLTDDEKIISAFPQYEGR